MEPGERRALVTWKAHHDNGWVTAVVERPDRTFAAVAGLAGRYEVEGVKNTVEDAQSAAMSALKRSTGHTCSSSSCSEWEMNVRSEL
jgi:hypothetical protein